MCKNCHIHHIEFTKKNQESMVMSGNQQNQPLNNAADSVVSMILELKFYIQSNEMFL